MRNINIWVTFGVLICFASIAYAQSGTINVEILEIKEIKGQIAIALYNKSGDFLKPGKAYKGVFLKVVKKRVTYTFSNVQNGDYAIAIFHDINNNGEHDKNFLGLPKEGYGFSNGATATFGAPGFDKAAFRLSGTHTVKIKMKY